MQASAAEWRNLAPFTATLFTHKNKLECQVQWLILALAMLIMLLLGILLIRRKEKLMN